MTTKISMEDLKKTQNILADLKMTVLLKMQIPDNNEDFLSRIKSATTFMKNLEKVYWRCTTCGRYVAPDEGYGTDADGDSYCLKCWQEGI